MQYSLAAPSFSFHLYIQLAPLSIWQGLLFIYFRAISHKFRTEFVSASLRKPCGFFPWFFTGIQLILFLEFQWVLVFELEISKWCHTILQNFQWRKLVFSRISKGKVTNLKLLRVSLRKTYRQPPLPPPVWIFSRIGLAHSMCPQTSIPHLDFSSPIMTSINPR